jgi:Na+-transporting methylmalonyl-CoA/oxaloacetate decarboxylase gamma subunit
MKKLKRITRFLILLLILVLALSGIGIMINSRERYRDKETTIELMEKRKEDDEGELKEIPEES